MRGQKSCQMSIYMRRQRPHYPVENQTGIEQSTARENSENKVLQCNQNHKNTNPRHVVMPLRTTKTKLIKLTIGDYRDVSKAY